MGDDVNLQRAILASIQDVRRSSSYSLRPSQASTYRPSPSSLPSYNSRPLTRSEPISRPQPPPPPSLHQPLAGRRDILLREGIVPGTSSSIHRSPSISSSSAAISSSKRPPSPLRSSPSRPSNSCLPAAYSPSSSQSSKRSSSVSKSPSSSSQMVSKSSSAPSASSSSPESEQKSEITPHKHSSTAWRLRTIHSASIVSSDPKPNSSLRIDLPSIRDTCIITNHEQETLDAINSNHFRIKCRLTLPCASNSNQSASSSSSSSASSLPSSCIGIIANCSQSSAPSSLNATCIAYYPKDKSIRLERITLTPSQNSNKKEIIKTISSQQIKGESSSSFPLEIAVEISGSSLFAYLNGSALFRDSSSAAASSSSSSADGPSSAGLRVFDSLALGDVGMMASNGIKFILHSFTVETISPCNIPLRAKPLPCHIDPKFAAMIESDIILHNPGVSWESIAGLEDAKRLLNEAAVLPMVVPELFQGIRQPWKGVLLYGPPGTGKTLLCRALASLAQVTFFSTSSSTLLSRWLGESEKLVRTLFQMARHHAPSIIFIDEIDALISTRGAANENEALRRVKSEFLQQVDGLVSSSASSASSGSFCLLLGTTNRPWDCDSAMLRRLEKRIYVGMPDFTCRIALFKICIEQMVKNVAEAERPCIDVDMEKLAEATDGYSSADIVCLVREAAMMPLRKMTASKSPMEIRAMQEAGKFSANAFLPTADDFDEALRRVQPSIRREEIAQFEAWAKEQGVGSLQ